MLPAYRACPIRRGSPGRGRSTLRRLRGRPSWNWPARLLPAVVALSLIAAACGSRVSPRTPPATSSAARGPEAGRYYGIQITPPIAKPDVTLTDTTGAPFSLRQATDGYVTLLYVGYTHCPDVCPLQMATIAGALKKVPPDVAAKIKVVFVTADLERDTPQRLREWLDLFDRRFIGLAGRQAAIDAVQRALGMAPATKEPLGGGNYAVNHAAYVLAYTTDDLAHLIYPQGFTADDWAHDLEKLVRQGWTGG